MKPSSAPNTRNHITGRAGLLPATLSTLSAGYQLIPYSVFIAGRAAAAFFTRQKTAYVRPGPG